MIRRIDHRTDTNHHAEEEDVYNAADPDDIRPLPLIICVGSVLLLAGIFWGLFFLALAWGLG